MRLNTKDKYQMMVEEFHRTFGLTVNDKPTKISEADRSLREKLHVEEFTEYFLAKDNVELVDGLTDLAYVLYGTAVSYGVEVHDRIDSFLIDCVLIGLRREMEQPDFYPQEIADGISMAIYCILVRFQQIGIDFDACFTEVHRSNMTKLWTRAETCELVRLESMKKDDDGLTSPPDFIIEAARSLDIYDMTTRAFIVRSGSGKAQKPPGYSPANLAQFIPGGGK